MLTDDQLKRLTVTMHSRRTDTRFEPPMWNVVIHLLQSARKQIENPRHWIKGCYAGRRTGGLLGYDVAYLSDNNADCWCLMGALHYSAMMYEDDIDLDCLAAAFHRAVQELSAAIRLRNLDRAQFGPGICTQVTEMNDRGGTTHEDVISLLDEVTNVMIKYKPEN